MGKKGKGESNREKMKLLKYDDIVCLNWQLIDGNRKQINEENKIQNAISN